MNCPPPHTLCTEIELVLPFWQYVAIFDTKSCACLLDSGMNQARPGQYSYISGDPAALLTGQLNPQNHRLMDLTLCTWRHGDGLFAAPPTNKHFTADPFAALRTLRARYPASDNLKDILPPFTSGFLGYFGYETAHAIEDLALPHPTDNPIPTLAFMVVDEVLVHDHTTGKTALYVTGRGPDAASVAQQRTAIWQERLATLTPKHPQSRPGSGAICAQFDRQQYTAAVQQCREHILAGDVFEVCLTQRLTMELTATALDVFRALRAINPAPFASYLQLPGFQVVSASPERFLKLDRKGLVESRPIKGTRPRGATAAKDQQLADELASAAKDRAENIMIVDLVRNDLGKVCEIGSIEVPELLTVESYATVHQLVSTVRGLLRPAYDAFDLVRAAFPGGSMTGAPKIEAMKIIASIEPDRRGIYSGALGFIGASGGMDLSMVIRTIVCHNGTATFGVGGAIVADSEPDAEYEETRDKARALIAALTSRTTAKDN